MSAGNRSSDRVLHHQPYRARGLVGRGPEKVAVGFGLQRKVVDLRILHHARHRLRIEDVEDIHAERDRPAAAEPEVVLRPQIERGDAVDSAERAARRDLASDEEVEAVFSRYRNA